MCMDKNFSSFGELVTNSVEGNWPTTSASHFYEPPMAPSSSTRPMKDEL